ncbi:PAS domain-containing protein [Pleurocapsales cyanobacterium LEGE 06147]|nr:PAS domain-containing protein [Pleurocapsales cyanobacterium LEGE 06147]
MTEDGKTIAAIEKQGQSILESIDDGFWVLDCEWHCTYINDRQAELLGILKEDILGKNVWELLPNLVGTDIYTQSHRALAEQTSVRFEHFCSKRQRWFEFRVYPSANGVSAISLDITQHKQTEEALRQTHYELEQQTIELEATNQELEQVLEELKVTEEELRVQNEELSNARQIAEVERQRYQDLFEFAPDGYAVTDAEGMIREANRAIAALLSIEPDCLIDTPLAVYIVHSDRQAFRNLLARLQQQPQLQTIELSLKSPKRDSFPAAITVSPIRNELEELTGFRWLVRDISKRKQEERRKEAQYKVTRVLAEATTFVDAVPAILQSLCESLKWELGVIWSVDNRERVLRYVNSWQTSSVNLQEFIEVNQQTTFALGVGLPGRIWQSRKPLWISELGENKNFLRAASAAKEELHAVFGFPILLGKKILGVIECFSTHPQKLDEDLLQMMEAIGSQIGQFMERKRTEATLQQNQRLFQKFMDNSPATAFIKDEAGRYVYVNAALERLFNRTRANWIGKTDFDFFPPENARKFRQNDLVVLAEKRVISRLETAQLADGEHHYMSFKFPLQDVSGERLVAGMSIDITDRVRAEEALKEQERRYRYIFETAGVAICEENFSEVKTAIEGLKQQGVRDFRQYFAEHPDFVRQAVGMVRVVNVNRTTVQMFGARDKQELLTSLDRFFLPETLEVFMEELFTIAEGKTFFEAETILQTLQGKRLKVIFTIAFPPATESFDSVLVSIMDITERIRAEEALRLSDERFRLAARAVNGIVYDWNVQTGTVYRSEGLYRLIGVHPDACTQTSDWWSQRMHPDDLARIQPIMNSLIEGKGRDRYEFEYRVRHEDGRWIEVWDRGYLICAPDGQLIRVVGSTYDISDRKEMENSLRLAHQQIKDILESITDAFVALDRQWQFTYVNCRAEQLMNRERQKLIGQCVWDLFPEAIDSEIYQQLHRAVSEQIAVNFETKGFKDLNRWFEVHVYPLPEGLAIYFQDISERKQAEEALRQSEARLNIALKNSPITVFNQDRELRYTWIYNPALNYKIDDAIGKGDDYLFSSHDTAILTQIKRRVLETGIGTREEVKIASNGQDYYYDLTVEPLQDGNDEIIGITCAAVNISEHKEMELAIRKSETVLNAFLASSPIGMAFLDGDLRYIYANEALAATNGIPLAEHLGRTVWEVLPAWAPYVQATINRVIETKEPLLNQEVSGETNPPGVYRHGLVNYYPVCLPDGEVLGVGVSSLDITELKRTERALRESEEKYRSLVKASSQIVWRANSQGQFIEIQGWEEFTGQSVEELLAGSKEAIHPDDLPKIKQAWWNAVATKSPYEVEHRIRKYDGTYEYFAGRGIPMLDAEGQVYAWVGMSTNIHERKQVEIERERLLEQERRIREEAEAANRIKDEFLAVLSHELRSPLNPILGWVQLLRRGKYDEQTIQRALEIIERNAKLQTQLIEDLLDVSRILRGKMVLNVCPVDLVSVIEGAIETVRLAAEAKGIEIYKILTADLGRVSGDSARLQQVVWNLLSNAVKFTPRGGRVEIRLSSIADPSSLVEERQITTDKSQKTSDKGQMTNYAQIQVSDTGKGIHPEFLPHVFDYFRQEDGKTTRKFGGLGLGLAIVRHLVELHGGTVRVESPGEGLGATFEVRLPLITSAAEESQDNELLVETMNLNQLRILVVDDEVDMRELAIAILQQYEAEVKIAASAVEALILLDQFKPDILISDIGMPELDGYGLIRQVRQLPHERGGNIPAIALTAYAGESDQKQALQAGFQRHIPKPIEPSELVKTIALLINRRCDR